MIVFIIALVKNLITLLAPNYANKPLTSSLVGSIDRVSENCNESNPISLIVWKAYGTLLFCVVHYWTWTVWLLLVLMVIVALYFCRQYISRYISTFRVLFCNNLHLSRYFLCLCALLCWFLHFLDKFLLFFYIFFIGQCVKGLYITEVFVWWCKWV